MKHILLFAITALLLFGCTKFTENNISGKWKLMEFTVDGTSQMDPTETVLELKDDNTAVYIVDGTQVDASTWSVNKKDQTLSIGVNTYNIISNKGTTLKLQLNINGLDINWVYEKQ